MTIKIKWAPNRFNKNWALLPPWREEGIIAGLFYYTALVQLGVPNKMASEGNPLLIGIKIHLLNTTYLLVLAEYYHVDNVDW